MILDLGCDTTATLTRLLQPLLQHADMKRQFWTHFRRVTTRFFRVTGDGVYAGAASWVSGGASTSVTRRGDGIPRRRKTAVATLSGSETTRYRFPATSNSTKRTSFREVRMESSEWAERLSRSSFSRASLCFSSSACRKIFTRAVSRQNARKHIATCLRT